MIRKERASGSYHLSAYYMAKTLSELPLVLALPSFYFLVVYWASGVNTVNASAFFGSWFILLLNSLTAQVGTSGRGMAGSSFFPSTVDRSDDWCIRDGPTDGTGDHSRVHADHPPGGRFLHQEPSLLALLDPVPLLHQLQL